MMHSAFLFPIVALLISIGGYSQPTIQLEDTTLNTVIPLFNQLTIKRDNLRDKEAKLKTEVSINKAKLAKYQSDVSEVRIRLEEKVASNCDSVKQDADTLIFEQIAAMGLQYLNAIDSLDVKKDLLREMTIALRNIIDEKDICQRQINELITYIPVAAKNHKGGFKNLYFKGVPYMFYVVDLDSELVQLHLVDTSNGKDYLGLKSLVNSLGNASMATNAGMFTGRYKPQGLYISHDIKGNVFPIDTTDPNDDNFYLLPNGVFAIDKKGRPIVTETNKFIQIFGSDASSHCNYATQSGPMLLIDGIIHPSFTKGSKNLNIRSGVGVIDSQTLVFAISMQPVNFYDFSSFFKEIYSCVNALYLDGAISEMYIKGMSEGSTYRRFGPMISVTPK